MNSLSLLSLSFTSINSFNLLRLSNHSSLHEYQTIQYALHRRPLAPRRRGLLWNGVWSRPVALEQGLRVAIASSNPTRVKDAVERLQKATNSDDAKVVGYTVDLSGPDVEAQLEKLLTEVKNGFDKKSLNHIVFTAGNSIEHRKTKDIDLDFIQRCGMVRFVAPLLIGKLAPRFVENHWSSSITLTSGKVANKLMPEYTVLTAYAAGAEGMTRNLALDLKPIRVNLVSPGAVLTELWGPNPDGIIAALSQKMPLGKVGSVEEAAEPYIYLMKDTNSTGSIIPTNGGELLL